MATVSHYKAPINHEILRWARESLFVDIDKAAKTASVKTGTYKKWEQGEDFPSISKLRKPANLFKRPLPVFFMPHVPETPPIPKDFRKPATGLPPRIHTSLTAIRVQCRNAHRHLQNRRLANRRLTATKKTKTLELFLRCEILTKRGKTFHRHQ